MNAIGKRPGASESSSTISLFANIGRLDISGRNPVRAVPSILLQPTLQSDRSLSALSCSVSNL